ncbi:hypothetical protein SRHO_G00303770 [Serrasalmus rhombeus]
MIQVDVVHSAYGSAVDDLKAEDSQDIKGIKARFLKPGAVGTSQGPPTSLQSLPPRSSSSTSSSCQSSDKDWMDPFLIPWDKFPEELMQSLDRGKCPSPRMRREMVPNCGS